MGDPKVSVVIPAYNHEQYVAEAIRSVLDQTFQDFELIIINDGSTDHTEEEILKFKDERIRYFSQENRGLSATLNRGIELAGGEYFNFLPSDDAFSPEKLEVQINAFRGDPALGVVFSYPLLVDVEGREIKDDPAALWAVVPYETKEEIFPALFERNFLSAPTALIRKDCLQKVGRFDESMKYAQDYDLWMRVLKYYDVRLLKQFLVKYRWHGENLTYRSTPQTEWERERVLLKAYKNLAIEEIFPHLRRDQGKENYSVSYRRLAEFVGKSGIPSLVPVSQIYQDRAKAMEGSSFVLPERGEIKEWVDAPFQSLKAREMIHVLVETRTFDRGGLEHVVFDLAKGLDRAFFKVVVVAIERGGYFGKRCKEIGIPFEVLQYDRPREYQEVLERYQIDLVLSHYSTFGARLAFEKGIPSLSVIHNIYSWFPDNLLTDFRSADPFVSGYIAVSEEVKQYAHYRFNIPSDKIVVIPNGIDIEESLSHSPSQVIHRSELGLAEGDYVFVNVASIGPPKAQNVILAALDRIVREYPQIKVISVGGILDEGYADFLRDRISILRLSDHFRVVGPVEDVRPYLRISDAFLLTSLIEGWPLSVMEAMLHELPVITTKVGGVSEILADRGGILLENSYGDFRLLDVPSLDHLSRETSPRNADEVAEAMKRFFKEKETWRESGKAGHERVVKHFSVQKMIRSYEKEIISLYVAVEKSRGLKRLIRIQEHEKLADESRKALEGLKGQIHHLKETVDSRVERLDLKIDLLDSKTSSKYQDIERQLDYILVRLSVKERMKGVIYRLMKQVHKLAPVALRERYQKDYRRVFFDKVTPSDKKLSFEERISTQGAGVLGREEQTRVIQSPEKNPIRGFWAFREEIKKGLPVELEAFETGHTSKLVSVVLPVFNQADLLGGSIESVLNQTYRNLELIVVDDGSTDGIEKVLKLYREDPRVRILHQENQKLPKALSNGFREARGEFFTWTSADNFMDYRQLERQVEFLVSHPDVQMVYANYDILDEDGRPLLYSDYCPGYQTPPGSNHIHLPRDLSELNVVRNNYIGPCFMYRCWVGRLVGDYDASMFTMEDYDYWMTINAFFRIEHLGEDDSFYFNRIHPDSLTGKKKELKIVQKTDQLMEFEKARRAFYRKKFNVYLLGNDDRLSEIEGLLNGNGNEVKQFHIPCEHIEMTNEKALGIWIASPLEKGFVTRVMKENPHAFFVAVHLDSESEMGGELMKDFGMKVFIRRKEIQTPRNDSWFRAEELSSALYPILCKANIQLFRREDTFDRWNP